MYIVGDLHRNFHYLEWYIKNRKIENTDFFQVGDLGIGSKSETTENKILENLNDFLAKRKINLYACRGNHDDPAYFQGNHIYNNLQLMPDYSIVETQDGYRVLLIGGAISLDRRIGRAENKLSEKFNMPPVFWEDEGLELKTDILKKVVGINTVITHTAPTYCQPRFNPKKLGFIKRYSDKDPELIADVSLEREKLNRLFLILNKKNNIKYHFYGHFHRYYITDNNYTQHICLGKSDIEKF